MWQDPSQFWGPLPSCVCGSHQWKSMLGVGNLHARNIRNDSSKYLFDFLDFWVREGEREKSAWKHSLCPQWCHLPPHLSPSFNTRSILKVTCFVKLRHREARADLALVASLLQPPGPTVDLTGLQDRCQPWLPAFKLCSRSLAKFYNPELLKTVYIMHGVKKNTNKRQYTAFERNQRK